MKLLKNLLLAVGLFVAVLLLVALFLKKDYNVVREVIINKPVNEVFEFAKYLKNQDKYSKWETMDENSKKSYSGTDGTVGFIAGWESENPDVGTGEQEITKIIENERLELELRFIKPFKSVSTAYMTTEMVGENATKVTWGFDGKMNYPMNLMLLFFNMEKMIGDDLQFGLDKMKGILE